MNLKVLEQETFELLLNTGCFKIDDCGPLHSPINSFEIHRDDKQRLVLTTRSDGKSRKNLDQYPELPAGTVHTNIASITLVSPNMLVSAKGVRSLGTNRRSNALTNGYETTEKAEIDFLELVPQDLDDVHQLIEWVDNIDTALYIWPHNLKENIKTISTKTLGKDDFTISQYAEESSSNMRGCLSLKIAGIEIFIAPLNKQDTTRPSGRGFIIYKKFASEELRRKIRECLSYAFGLPLLYLGYTLLSDKCEFIGFKAVSPNIIDKNGHSLMAMPPVPVSSNRANLIDSTIFSKTVNAIFAHYDELNFQHISWIYWHAVYSPIHTKPVQLGAGIEALMNAYRKLEKPQYVTKLLDDKNSKFLKIEFLKIVEAMEIPDKEKTVLRNKAAALNNPPQTILNERFFECLRLEMSEKEKDAWNRRNDAAHGNPTKNGDSIELIRDVKLLKNIFHRIVISMTSASTQYIDVYTPRFPIRQLNESVDSNNRTFFDR